MLFSEQRVKFNFVLLYGSKTSNLKFFSETLFETVCCFTKY